MKRIITASADSNSLKTKLTKLAKLHGFSIEFWGEDIYAGFTFNPDTDANHFYIKFLPRIRVAMKNNAPIVHVDIKTNLTLTREDFDSYHYAMQHTNHLIDALYEDIDWRD